MLSESDKIPKWWILCCLHNSWNVKSRKFDPLECLEFWTLYFFWRIKVNPTLLADSTDQTPAFAARNALLTCLMHTADAPIINHSSFKCSFSQTHTVHKDWGAEVEKWTSVLPKAYFWHWVHLTALGHLQGLPAAWSRICFALAQLINIFCFG